MTAIRVLYFTIVDFDNIKGGGGISARNHIERLGAEPEVELFVVSAGQPQQEAGTLAYLHERGLRGAFITLEWQAKRIPWLTYLWPYILEREALQYTQVDPAVKVEIEKFRPDVVIVDYLASSLFCPSVYRSKIPVITLTHNPEADYHYFWARNKGRLGSCGRATKIGGWRLQRYEHQVYRASKAVIFIGKYDIEHTRTWHPMTFLMTPCLKPSPNPWISEGSRKVFFVGGIVHLPNRLAIEWLATKFAPELARVDPSITIQIIGAASSDVPSAWRPANLQYLGSSDRETVENAFRTCAFLIVPLSDCFGAKFKVMEALSFGTPVLATEGSLGGVTALPWLPTIQLENPAKVAAMVKHGVDHPESLQETSTRIRTEMAAYIQSQEGLWGQILKQVISH